LPAGLEYFLNTSQWLDAADADPSRVLPRLIEAIRKVLAGASPAVSVPGAKATSPENAARLSPWNRAIVVVAALVSVIILSFAVDKFRSSRRAESAQPAATMANGGQSHVPQPTPIPAFAPPAPPSRSFPSST
jgi:hypothetical protein